MAETPLAQLSALGEVGNASCKAVWPARALLMLCAIVTGCSDADNSPTTEGSVSAQELAPVFEIYGVDNTRQGFTKPMVRQLHNGHVLVADQGDPMLAEFDATGAFVRSIAVRGSGPGEIIAPFRIAIHRDTVVMISSASDARQVSWIDLATNTKGTLTPPRRAAQSETSSRYTVIDRVPSGSWFVREGAPGRVIDEMPAVGTLLSDSITIGMLRHSDVLGDSSFLWLPRIAQSTLIAFPWIGGPGPTALAAHPLRLGTLFVIAGDAIWTLDATTGQGQRWSASAPPVRFTVDRTSPGTVNAAELRSMLARTLPDARRALDTSRLTALFDPANAPDSAPYASSLVPVHDGTVWVETFALDSSIARTYIALDSTGRTRGVFSTPAGVRVRYVGPTLVLGTRRDPDGVEFIQAFARPGDG